MLTPQEAKRLDLNAQFFGVSALDLMENAGRGVAEVIASRIGERRAKVGIFCGTGNNGGDGFVAARYLEEKGYDVDVYLLGEEKIRSREAFLNYSKLRRIELFTADLRGRFDVVVDGVLGTGLRGEPMGPIAQFIDWCNSNKDALVVSIDVPTGFGSKKAVLPQITVTFHDLKDGMDEERCGEIIVVDIGIPEKAKTHVGQGDLDVYFPRPVAESHKGDNGKILIVGGGPYTGAPALSGMGALRCGADLVYLSTPESVKDVIAGYSPCFIMRPFEGDHLRNRIEEIAPLLQEVNCLLIGPGLGDRKDTLEGVRAMLNAAKDVPVVIDGDGIKALPVIGIELKGVVTPHRGEFSRLGGRGEDAEGAKALARGLGLTVLLKSPTDIITDGERVAYNDTGNVGMTVGGTGDVLSGIVAALLSKGLEPFRAACLGAFINGEAGDMAFEEKSYGLTPLDVIERIPSVLRRLTRA
jgi:NAD(P)H-hydrate epimerase